MGLKEAFLSAFSVREQPAYPAETSEDLIMEMRMHPQFKRVYWAAEDAGAGVTFYLRTFDDPSDRRGKTQTFLSREELYMELNSSEFQHRLAGKNFQISLTDAGQKLIEAFPRWEMSSK